MRTLLRAAVLGSLLAWSAAADARSIVVIPLAAGDGVGPEDAAQLGDAVAAAVRARGHEVLGPADAARAIDERTPGCVASRRPSCWASAAREMGNELVVSGRVARDTRTNDLSVNLEAIDVESVRVVAEASHHAVGTTRDEVAALARAVASTLLDALPAPRRRARLSITSEPSGAAVTVNSRLMGQTPWNGEVPEGPTTLLVEVEGCEPQSRSFSLQADEVQEVHVELAPEADGQGHRRRRGPHRFDIADGLLTGVAAVGILGGGAVVVASLAPGDECVGQKDPRGECERVERNGNLWPWAGVIGGGVLAGAIVLVRYAIGDRAPVQPTADLQAGTVGIAGRF